MTNLAATHRAIPDVYVIRQGDASPAMIARSYARQDLQDHINMIMENVRYLLINAYELQPGSFSIVHNADETDSAVIKFHNHDIDKARQDTGQILEIPKNTPEQLDDSWKKLDCFVTDLTAMSNQVAAKELSNPEQEIRVGAAKFEDYIVLNEMIAHLATVHRIGHSYKKIKRSGFDAESLRLHFSQNKNLFVIGEISDFTSEEFKTLPHSPTMISDFLRGKPGQKPNLRVVSYPTRDISGMN